MAEATENINFYRWVNARTWEIEHRSATRAFYDAIYARETGVERKRESYNLETSVQNGTVTIADGVAVFDVRGTMFAEDAFCGGMGAYSQAGILREMYADKSIKGILLAMDSGGGERGAGIVLGTAISEKNKPVGVLTNEILASAAYRAAANASFIAAANEDAEFGSIGTMMVLHKDWRERIKDLEFYYSSGSDGKNAAERGLKNEDTSILQQELDASGAAFRKTIANLRPITDAAKTLDGSVFATKDAKRRGLVDFNFTRTEAVGRILQMAKKGKY